MVALEQALRKLQETDPRRYAIVMRYTKRFVVWPGHYFAADQRGYIYVSAPFLLDSDSAQVASLLVHEAIHLRLQCHGIDRRRFDMFRIERRCVREQATFLRLLPGDGQQWALDVEEALQQKWWEESERQKHAERVMRDLDAPRWLQRIVRRVM